MPASKETLSNVHEALAEELLDRIKNGEDHVTKDGEVVRVKASPALLNVARQMLKDNGIEAVATPKSALGHLARTLPVVDDDPADEFPYPN